ncbi:MAG TPA: hypothetical protein VJ850_01600 [Candidatus Limnocylindrales bacterium]|nr:hypothetical protein [Candidatus Limnocylindrales bacterium]
MPRLVRVASGALLAFLSLAAAAPGNAFASCAVGPDPVSAVNSAHIVFVGKVTHVSSAGRTATVTVLEVWRGPDQPATLTINEGEDDNTFTSVDRTFVEGETYLFFPNRNPDSGKLTDNGCSSTMLFDVSASDLRPPDARPPIGGPALAQPTGFDLSPLLPIGVALLVFGVLLVVGLLARGRQES